MGAPCSGRALAVLQLGGGGAPHLERRSASMVALVFAGRSSLVRCERQATGPQGTGVEVGALGLAQTTLRCISGHFPRPFDPRYLPISAIRPRGLLPPPPSLPPSPAASLLMHFTHTHAHAPVSRFNCSAVPQRSGLTCLRRTGWARRWNSSSNPRPCPVGSSAFLRPSGSRFVT